MRPRIDHDRVELVLDTLLATYQTNGFPYNLPSAKLPQAPDNFPTAIKDDPRVHAMWLFCLCYYMRGGIKSATAGQQLARLYVRRPEVFDARLASQMTQSSLQRSLVAVDLRYLCKTVPHYWIENAQRLVEWYDGDVRNIFDGVDDYEEACRRVRNQSRRRPKSDTYSRRAGFQSFQEKMVSMLIYFLEDAELVKPFPHPLPVDFHVLRISVATGMVVFDGVSAGSDVYSKELLALMRQTFHDYAVQHGLSSVELANVLWLLSSTICSLNPGNITYGGSVYAARNTVLQYHEPIWDKKDVRSYERSCGQCPIEQVCAWDVPNAPYTLRGELIMLRPRGKPPLQTLF